MQVMVTENRHIYTVLTKRPQRLPDYLDWCLQQQRPYTVQNTAHIWVGVTVETPQYYWRIRTLMQTELFPVKYICCEPMLAPMPRIPLDSISWLIAGGESGQKARQTDINWLRQLKNRVEQKGEHVRDGWVAM